MSATTQQPETETGAEYTNAFDRDEPQADEHRGDVYVTEEFTAYGDQKVELQGATYEARTDIKTLDWETSHRTFDSDRDAWTMDASALPELRETLTDAGFAVEDQRGEDTEDDAPEFAAYLAGFTQGVLPGDRIEVLYQQKNGCGEATKTGTVVTARPAAQDDDPRVSFRRDDGQTMYVTVDGLKTAGSHAPHVGTVEAMWRLPPEDAEGDEEGEN